MRHTQASYGVVDSQVRSIHLISFHLNNQPPTYIDRQTFPPPESMDPLMVSYNESIYFDRAFYLQDIKGSIAFARANIATGILTPEEFSIIEKGLTQILEEWKSDTFVIKAGIDEDIHTANERRLGEIVGKDVAGKLHT